VSDGDDPGGATPRLARLVADADVLAADLLVGGPAREALDHWRRHSWVSLVVTDRLLEEAAAVIAGLADRSLAADWRTLVAERATLVEPEASGHPALVAAASGDAAHLHAYDERRRSAAARTAIRPSVEVSVKPPDGFARLFDPASLYEAAVGGAYPGPDRDPRR
jgi:hypothetical protein